MDVIAGLAGGRQFLADARARDLSTLTTAEIAAENAALVALKREADALQLALLAAGSRKDVAGAAGEPDLTSMVARQAGVCRKTAAQQIKLATDLDDAPATKQALGRPGMSPQKARIITDALHDLPADLTAAQRAQIEADLVEAAPDLSVEQFRRMARRCLETLDLERANQRENADLERQEAAQAAAAEFWLGRPDEATGMVSFGGKTDALTADMLRSLIEAKTAPRKRQDPTGMGPDHATVMGEAFAALVRDIPAGGGHHGGAPATLVVTITEDSLLGRTREAAVTSHGTTISAGAARRLACEAGLLPAVLDGRSQVLDLGHTRRLFSPAQHLALAQRDQGCAHPGCARPPGWTEAHHIDHWQRDRGPTDLTNGVLLCAFHHRLVHARDIAIRVNPDDGTPEFRIRGTWQRNHRYRPLRQPLLV